MDASMMQRDATWSSIPTELLRAELARRASDDSTGETSQPACGSGKRGAYDTGLHIFALVLILAISTLSCGFPLFKRRTSKGLRPSNVIFLCQHFGTGVLTATAFVHLLPTAFLSLTDPCLPSFFNKGYNPLAGLIAMIFALSVAWLESYLTTRGAGHSHAHMWEEVDSDEADDGHDASPLNRGNATNTSTISGLAARRNSSYRPDNIALGDMGDTEGLMAGVSPLPESTPTHQQPAGSVHGHSLGSSLGNGLGNGKQSAQTKNPFAGSSDDESDDDESLDLSLEELDPQTASASQKTTGRSTNTSLPLPHAGGGGYSEPLTPSQMPPDSAEQKRMMLQCLLLEAGILFHSVFIGMAISVATGPAFVVFLVAIAFHQCFEGLALGSRIAAIHFPRASYRPWLMVLAYGTTTPFGQAIGLLVHNLYDPMSQTGLLMVGIMNAISSGLLLFAGLVQLLAEDFLTEKSYKTLRGPRRNHAFLAVVAGATLMAAVGAFA